MTYLIIVKCDHLFRVNLVEMELDFQVHPAPLDHLDKLFIVILKM